MLTLTWRSSGRRAGRALGARRPSTCISITTRLSPGHSCLRAQAIQASGLLTQNKYMCTSISVMSRLDCHSCLHVLDSMCIA